jgi:ribosomal protein L11
MEASSGPPIGPTLGQYGIPAAQFRKDFNERTAIFNADVRLSVTIEPYKSGTYHFDAHTPTTTFFIKRCVKSHRPGKSMPLPGFLHMRNKFIEKRLSISSRRRRFDRKLRFNVITVYLIYELLMYRNKYELLKLPIASGFKRVLGSLKSMGVYILAQLLHAVSVDNVIYHPSRIVWLTMTPGDICLPHSRQYFIHPLHHSLTRLHWVD